MTEHQDFDYLERTAKRIAAHRNDPGNQELLRAYLDDIEGCWREGRLSFVEWSGLVVVLLECQPNRREPPLA